MPDIRIKHPTPQQLADYGLGKLSAEATSTIHEHLLACPECSRQVENQPPDSFIGQLKAGSPQGGTMLPAVPTPPPSLSNTVLPVRKAAQINKPLDDVPAELAGSSKFDIVGKLGQGGMGAVYKAKHKFLGDHVAIKVMNADMIGNPDARSRFLREMHAAGQLKHPNIVRALDAEQIGDILVLVMEFVPGITLDQLVKQRGPLAVDFSCNCIMQAALGLQHAHEKKMVHRDIKPGNLIITAKEKEVKLLDFGLVRGPREQGQKNQTQMQTFMGTPEYVAPEQATDARSADIRADIYSLGCTLYFLLAGRPPFRGTTAMSIILAQIQDEVEPLPEVRAEVPVALWAVVAKMMAKAPVQRYQTPIEVAEALKPFAVGGAKVPSKASGLPDWYAPPPQVQTPPSPPPRNEESPFAPLASSPPPVRRQREQAQGKRKSPAWMVYMAVAAGLMTVSLFALLVLTFRTTKGKVVVEIDQKDAQVFVDGKNIKIHVPGELHPIEIHVEVGAHQLKVKKDNFETVTRDFSYRQGKTDAIQVRMKPLAVRGKALPKEITNSIGMRLVLIPAGKFLMGSPKTEVGRHEVEGPQREVEIMKAYYMGVYEVTQAEYQKVMGNNPSANTRGDKFPVTNVNWDDAMMFCKKLTGKKKEDGRAYRLPTEAEWEYASRAGTTTANHFGDSLSSEQVNFRGDSPYGDAAKGKFLGRTTEVGSYKANAFGLYDMYGNVWEWCSDWFDKDYHKSKDIRDPKITLKGDRRVLRGGSCLDVGSVCRSAFRGGMMPGFRGPIYGFRVTCDSAKVSRLLPAAAKEAIVMAPPKEITNLVGMKLAYIPPGKFSMGSLKDERDRSTEEEEHQLEITKGFYLGAYEVTQREYEMMMGKNPSWFSKGGIGKSQVDGMDTSRFPVENVSYEDAVEFCKKLTTKTAEKGRVYRLPTEAEWEYACRAGTKTPFHYGGSLSSNQANFNGNGPYGGAAKSTNLQRTCEVGRYKPNAWGLYDMHGNVWEWCSDWLGKYDNGNNSDPKGPKCGTLRVLRGGSFDDFGRYCRAAHRNRCLPGNRYSFIGFRVVCGSP